MQEEMQEAEKDEYDALVEDFEELSDSYYEQRLSDQSSTIRTPWTAQFTGLLTGTIRDAQSKGHCIELTVETADGRHTILLDNTGEYTQDNEFARFLEWYNIHIEDPSELFGTTVTLVTGDEGWSLYLPNSLDAYSTLGFYLDTVARTFGCQSLRKPDSTYNYVMPAFLLSVLYFTITTLFSGLISTVAGDQLSTVAFVGIFIGLFIIGSALSRIAKITYRDIRKKREKSSIY